MEVLCQRLARPHGLDCIEERSVAISREFCVKCWVGVRSMGDGIVCRDVTVK